MWFLLFPYEQITREDPTISSLQCFYRYSSWHRTILPRRAKYTLRTNSYLHLLYHALTLLQYKNPPTNCCRPRDVHRSFLLLSSLVTFHKNIFSTFRTNTCMLQCTSKATIFGRQLVLLPEDCDLRLHRNPAMEI